MKVGRRLLFLWFASILSLPPLTVAQAQDAKPEPPKASETKKASEPPKSAPATPKPQPTPEGPPQNPIGLPDVEEPLAPPPDSAVTDILPNRFAKKPADAIKLLEEQLKQRPKDFITRAALGNLYASVALEGGDLALLAKAEDHLRTAVKDSPGKPTKTQLALAGVLCDRHKFQEGLQIARTVLKDSSRDVEALMIAADCHLEMGEYDQAEHRVKQLNESFKGAEALARSARIAELKGDLDRAGKLLGEAAVLAKQRHSDEQAAWFEWRLADFDLNRGKLDEAAKRFEEILKTLPDYHDAVFDLGKIRAFQGRTQEAVDLVERAVKIGAEPHMLSFLGDLHAKLGDKKAADAAHKRIIDECLAETEYRRAVAAFLLDHDRDLPKALQLAQADFDDRPDIFAKHTLAWALHKNGKSAEAVPHMKDALKLGTKDAFMFYHAAQILENQGFKERAREYLDMVFELNPHFSILHVESAKTLRDSLPKRPQ